MLKRVVPFILTFAIGLLIASFFVSILPSFEFKRGRRHKRAHEIKELKLENERLRLESTEKQNLIEELQDRTRKLQEENLCLRVTENFHHPFRTDGACDLEKAGRKKSTQETGIGFGTGDATGDRH